MDVECMSLHGLKLNWFNSDMKHLHNKLAKFKQWILSIVIGYFFPELEYVLNKFLIDSKDQAEDWARDYNEYDYVKIAKRYIKIIKRK
jgi:hypothetical protein